MKKANLLACLLSPMLAIAQPQADSLRHLIHVKGPQVHLLAQMAEATATSHPDTALHYAQLARQRKAAGRDLITLEAATGEALMAQGQIEQSLKHFTQAYNQARQQHLAPEAYNQLCSIGLCHSRMQHFDKAAKCYDQVITYATRHKNAQLAFSAYQNYGAMCSRMGRVEDCQRLLLNALKYQSAADPALRVSVYAGLGTILTYNAATFPKAEQYLRQGIAIARRAHEPLAEASCLSPLITLLTQQPQRYAEIPALIARANTIVSNAAPDGTERMQLEHAKINYYFVTRQWSPALQSALMLYKNGPAVSSERDKVMLMVARAYEGTGNPQRACYFYREAYYIGDSIHQLDVQQQVGDAAARYDAKEKQLKITQLQKNAAEAEVKQWRLGAALAGIVLLLFATIVAAIIWHRQQRRKAQLDQARRYIDGIESERKRLAQELHDGVCNDLLVAEMQMSTSTDVGSAVAQLQQVRGTIRQISHQLMPPNTTFATLDQTLSALAYKLQEIGQFSVTFTDATPANAPYDWSQLSTEQAYQLYRIAQELITNLVKHTQGLTHIDIALAHSTVAPTVELSISHNVTTSPIAPFDAASTATTTGIGIQSISERLKAISATIKFTSDEQGEHTIITC